MKRIIVYADFDFLTSPEEIGTVSVMPYWNYCANIHFIIEIATMLWAKFSIELAN